jgi:hypothetical protein
LVADLLYGRCATLAIALHKLTGLPLYGLTGYDEGIGQEALIHAYVRWKDDLIIDVKGPRQYEDMISDFMDDPAMVDAGESKFSVADLSKMATGSRRCPSLKSVEPIAKRIWQLANSR